MEKFIEGLKNRLKQPLPGCKAQFKLAPKTRLLGSPDKTTINAGVLILFYPVDEQIHTVLIKRPEYDGPHSGQVSFPGGKFETSDKNIIQTALRESHEEIGVNPANVKVLGELSSLFIPVSNFLVHPVIGIVKEKPCFKIDPKEVAYLIESDIREILHPSVEDTSIMIKGKSYEVPYYNIQNEIVWGATSMILSELTEILSDCFNQQSFYND